MGTVYITSCVSSLYKIQKLFTQILFSIAQDGCRTLNAIKRVRARHNPYRKHAHLNIHLSNGFFFITSEVCSNVQFNTAEIHIEYWHSFSTTFNSTFLCFGIAIVSGVGVLWDGSTQLHFPMYTVTQREGIAPSLLHYWIICVSPFCITTCNWFQALCKQSFSGKDSKQAQAWCTVREDILTQDARRLPRLCAWVDSLCNRNGKIPHHPGGTERKEHLSRLHCSDLVQQ